MKKQFKMLAFAGLVMMFATACQKPVELSSKKDEATKEIPDVDLSNLLLPPCDCDESKRVYGDGSIEDSAGSAAPSNGKAEAIKPTISAVEGEKGGVNPAYSTYLVADVDGKDADVTIKGTNFGKLQGKGSVSLVGVSSFTVSSISSWTDTSIKFKMKSGYNSVPAPSSLNNNVIPEVKVTTDGGLSITKQVKLVPRVFSREYSQCTWFASKRRAETGRSIQPRGQSYSAYSGVVNASYMPQTGDILIWHNAHQAFIESVTTSATGWVNNARNVTYVVNISEYNVTPYRLSSYQTTVVVTEKRDAKGVVTRTIKSGLYRSGRASSATNYYR